MKITIIVLLSLLTQLTSASPIVIPSQSNLLERSDLVITASFIKTDETAQQRKIKQNDAVRVLSHFRIDSVLKGKTSQAEIVLGHYRKPPNNSSFDAVRLTTDHFSFISFSNPLDKYLIYVKRDENGAYAPATGEIDPQYSFWKLESVKETTAEQAPAGDS